MRKKNGIILLAGLLLMSGLTACGDKNKIKGEWTVSEIGFYDNGNYSSLTSQTFVDTTIFPGTILQFDGEICNLWDSYSDIDMYLDYSLQNNAGIVFEKDNQEYTYEYNIDGDTLEFKNIPTSQSISGHSDGMSIICTRNTEE